MEVASLGKVHPLTHRCGQSACSINCLYKHCSTSWYLGPGYLFFLARWLVSCASTATFGRSNHGLGDMSYEGLLKWKMHYEAFDLSGSSVFKQQQ